MQAAHQTPSLVRSLSVSEALTLCPHAAGVLRVTQGRIWATIDLDSRRTLADAGDHFIAPGQDLRLRAGQRVVLEAWPMGQASVQWQWLPVAMEMECSRWQNRLAEPLRDLGRLVVRATARLVSARA